MDRVSCDMPISHEMASRESALADGVPLTGKTLVFNKWSFWELVAYERRSH